MLVNEKVDLKSLLKSRFNSPTIEGSLDIICNKLLDESKNKYPPVSLDKIVKYLGIRTRINNSLSNDAILGVEGNKFKIEYKEVRNWRRQRFSVAHEIMHVLLYQLFNKHLDFNNVEINQLEKICNLGASKILLPYEHIKKDFLIEKYDYLYFKNLINKYDVSFSAILWKANDLNPEKSFYIWKKYARNSKDKNEYRVYLAFQKYIKDLRYAYLPVGCTQKHLSKRLFELSEIMASSGKIRINLNEEYECSYHMSKIDNNKATLFSKSFNYNPNYLLILEKEKMKVYISGALMSAKNLEKNRTIYFELAETCKELGSVPHLPHLNCDPIKNKLLTSETVFKNDYSHLENSDIVLAYLDDPSLGVGAEVAIAHFYGKIIIGIHSKSSRVSRFLSGMIESSPNSFLVDYTSMKNLKLKTRKILKNLNSELAIQSA